MRKNKLLPLLLLSVAAATLLAVLLLVNNLQKEPETTWLFSLPPERVDGVRYTSGTIQAELCKTGDGVWVLAGDVLLPLNQQAVQEMVQSMLALQAERTLPPDADPTETGLDTPQTTITLRAGEGEQTLKAGNMNSVTKTTYAQLQSDTIYMVSSAALSGLCRSPRALYAPQAVSGVRSADLVGFTVENGDAPLHFVWQEQEEWWSLEDDPEFPLEQVMVTRMANTLCNLQSVWSITTPEEEAVYGLDAPNATVTARLADGSTVTCRFGYLIPTEDEDDAGRCFVACDAAPGVVFEVLAEHLNAFAYTKEALWGALTPVQGEQTDDVVAEAPV